MVARFVRDEEVVGSNPATPTNENGSHKVRVGAILFEWIAGIREEARGTRADGSRHPDHISKRVQRPDPGPPTPDPDAFSQTGYAVCGGLKRRPVWLALLPPSSTAAADPY